MIRTSEAVLRGHPDKFCDQVADHILLEAYRRDPRAYAQVEVAVWSDHVFLTGSTVTREPLDCDFRDLVRDAGNQIGYTPGNSVDANRYLVHDHVCRLVRDPREWTDHVNDQAITIGWAGYDEAVAFLPPEHFLAHSLRVALDRACAFGGPLAGHGPDGKLVVRIDETPALGRRRAAWRVAQVLVTLQQRRGADPVAFQGAVAAVVLDTLRALADADPRWRYDRDALDLLVNPNGPFLDGGSNSDNGQTGRKLVMDYYGPRIPIGGGALSGKDLCHIDRAAAYAARASCVAAVLAGAPEALVRLTWGPGIGEPLDVSWSFPQGGRPPARCGFGFHEIVRRALPAMPHLRELGRGGHFFDPELPWNGGTGNGAPDRILNIVG